MAEQEESKSVDDLIAGSGGDIKPATRNIQQLGRVDVPQGMLNALGVRVEDEVIVRYNDDKNCVEVHNRSEVLEGVFE